MKLKYKEFKRMSREEIGKLLDKEGYIEIIYTGKNIERTYFDIKLFINTLCAELNMYEIGRKYIFMIRLKC